MDRRGGYRDRRRAPAASTPEVLEIIPLDVFVFDIAFHHDRLAAAE
jgi:hypothetical protein